VTYQQLPAEVFKANLPKELAEELLVMYNHFDAYGFGAKVSDNREIRGLATKLEEWLLKNRNNEKFAALLGH